MKEQLEACFYGTLVDRDPKSGVSRKKRAEDGWRHGVSNPFKVGNKEYDVQDTQDDSKKLFDGLMAGIEAKEILQLIKERKAPEFVDQLKEVDKDTFKKIKVSQKEKAEKILEKLRKRGIEV